MPKTKPKPLTSQQQAGSELDEPIFERFKTCKSLPALPPIASNVLKMSRREDADAEKLAALISQDPAIVARLLHIANSGYYGGARHKVISVVQAVTLLGMNAIGSLAFSFCFYRLFRDLHGPNQPGLDHRTFWKRSMLAGVAGRALGQLSGEIDSEVVFLGSLLQDIGLLALNEVLPGAVRHLTDEAQGNHSTLQQLEIQRLGCDHAQMGAWLAEVWQLPEEYHSAIRYSHDPEQPELSGGQEDLVRRVALSGRVADIWCGSDTEEMVQEAAQAAQQWLEINPEMLETILDQVAQGLPEVAGFFQIHLGSTEELEQVLKRAKDTLHALHAPLS